MFDYRLNDEQLIALRGRFEKVYVRQAPKPEAKTSKTVRWSLIALVIASVIVSASHTIPAFLSTIEGAVADVVKFIIAVSALVMVEVGMLVLAYVLSRRLADVDPAHITTQLKRGLALAFVLALLANLHSTLAPRFGETAHWDKFSFFVFVLMGVSAPTLAYIAGEVFGLTTLQDERDNEDAVAEWQRKFEEAWEAALMKYQRDMVKVTKPVSVQPAIHDGDGVHSLPRSVNAVNEQVNERAVNPVNGYTKRMDAREVITGFFQDHPDTFTMPLDELVLKIKESTGVKVGRGSIHNVRTAMNGKPSERSDAPPPASSIE